MTKKASTPALRFKGFTYTWEQRKLGEILQEHNTRTSDFESNPLYSLTIESGITPKTDRYERSSLVTKTEDLFKVVKPNEFVTNPMNLRFGALGYNKNAFDISVSGYYDVFSIDDDKCSGFWNSYFKTPTAMNIFDNAATGSLIEKRRVKYSTLQQLVFYMPRDLSEKAEIGKYMDTLDRLITLHQHKYDKLTNMKKSMLEKMFPNNGANVPEIRFKGFTDAWEQRKLSSLCDKFTDGDWIEAKDQSNSGVRLIQTGNVGVAEYLDKPNNKKWVSNDTFEALHCEEVFEGDILISRLPEPAGRACIVPNLGTKMITAVDCTIVRVSKNTSNEFLLQYLSSQNYFDEVNTCLAGGTRQRISRSNLANFDVPMPTKKSEQVAIGSFFTNLDHLITLHYRELEKLKNLKKACLEKMFV
ncbi:MAG: restriction endonuclease subunit S [Oscillospiraceae bacterium]